MADYLVHWKYVTMDGIAEHQKDNSLRLTYHLSPSCVICSVNGVHSATGDTHLVAIPIYCVQVATDRQDY